METKRIWVVISGLVRKPSYFLPSLTTLLDSRDKGLIEGIVYCTWEGEIDNYPGLRDFLKAGRIVVVECPQLQSPTADLSHNIERQKFLVYWALTCVPSDAYVLKTRPDQVITINSKFFGLLDYLHKLDMTVAERDKALLPARIWCGRLAPNIPFWYDDRYFFTTHAVAVRMTAMSSDIRILAHPNNFIAEINWYQPLFASTTLWANAMMRVNWLSIAQLPPEASEAYKANMKQSNIYWLSLALYESVTMRFMRVGYTGFDLADYDYLGEDPNRPAELPIHFDRFLDFMPGFDTNPAYLSASALCENLLSGPINDLALWRDAANELVIRSPQFLTEVVAPKIS